MHLPEQIAQQLRAVYFGGNWTSVNLKDTLAGVSLQDATARPAGTNTICTLVYHLGYYVREVNSALQTGSLNAKDEWSFRHPAMETEEDWQSFLEQTWEEGRSFADTIAGLPEEKFGRVFIDEKYGTLYRNLTGIIEHIHYHLGQIVIVKKWLAAGQPAVHQPLAS